MQKQVNRFLSGALILTIAGVLSKILSAFYRIPLQNLTGDLGFYSYQQVYPILALVMIVSLYGFPVAISRMVSKELQIQQGLSFTRFILPVFIGLSFFAFLFSLSLWFLASYIAEAMSDPYLARPIRWSASLFLFLPFLSLLRGLAQGSTYIEQVAYSQVTEQLFRVGVIIASAVIVAKGWLPVRSMAEAGVFASLLGMLAGILFLLIFFSRKKLVGKTMAVTTSSFSVGTYLRTLFVFGFLASLNHLTLIFIQMVDALTLVPQLVKAGFSSLEAMEAKGVFDRGIPLIQFGAVLGSSFALALLPSLDQDRLKEDGETIREALFVSVYVASAATVGLILLYEEVNILLFKDAQGTGVLQVLALSIFLLSLAITGNAVLQGYGAITWTLVALFLSLLVKGFLNYFFIPIWATYGSALATVGSLACLSLFTLYGLRRYLPLGIVKDFPFLRFLLTNSILFLYLIMVKYIVQAPIHSRGWLSVYVILLVLSGALIYFLSLIRYRLVDERHLTAFPFANQLIKISEKIRK